jgi:hypothetical protein
MLDDAPVVSFPAQTKSSTQPESIKQNLAVRRPYAWPFPDRDRIGAFGGRSHEHFRLKAILLTSGDNLAMACHSYIISSLTASYAALDTPPLDILLFILV